MLRRWLWRSMKHEEFKIGMEFESGGRFWRCTDIGTRTVAAIALEGHDVLWFIGPPYPVEEIVFDERDLPDCTEVPPRLVDPPAAGSTEKEP